MDPEATLEQIRIFGSFIEKRTEPLTSPEWENLARGLAEYVTALDEWLQRGGFLPASWSRATAEAPTTAPKPASDH